MVVVVVVVVGMVVSTSEVDGRARGPDPGLSQRQSP